MVCILPLCPFYIKDLRKATKAKCVILISYRSAVEGRKERHDRAPYTTLFVYYSSIVSYVDEASACLVKKVWPLQVGEGVF